MSEWLVRLQSFVWTKCGELEDLWKERDRASSGDLRAGVKPQLQKIARRRGGTL